MENSKIERLIQTSLEDKLRATVNYNVCGSIVDKINDKIWDNIWQTIKPQTKSPYWP